MRSFAFISVLLVGLVAAGCAATSDDEPLDTVNSDLTVQAQVLGNIRSGETKADSYSGGAAYRAYAFRATGNDKITGDVTMVGGTARGYITDANFNVLAESGGGAGAQTQVTYVVPPGPSRALRIVFRNADATSGNFKVKLGVQAGACTGSEPWFQYEPMPPNACENTLYTCDPGEIPFWNACGCGCEVPQ